jgi:hypothetical protein
MSEQGKVDVQVNNDPICVCHCNPAPTNCQSDISMYKYGKLDAHLAFYIVQPWPINNTV